MNIELFATILSAFVVGSIPFGVLVGHFKGIDPRTAGSGNIGATNVARLMGWKSGLVVLFLDMLKGAGAAWAGTQFGHDYGFFGENFGFLAGFLAAFGHCFSVFLGGKGGKGVATALGATCVLLPAAAGLGVFVWVALAAFFRIAAVSSIAAMVVMAVVSRLNGYGFEADMFTVGLFCLIAIRHISNLKQLKQRWFGDSS